MFSKFNRHFIKAMQISIAGELTVAGAHTHRLQITYVIHTVEFVDKLYLRVVLLYHITLHFMTFLKHAQNKSTARQTQHTAQN